MKQRILFGLVVVGVVAGVLATASLGVISSSPVVRGSIGAFELHDKSQKLKLQSREPLDVDVRFVTLGANDTTGWHGHNGPSLVIVKSGSLTVSQPDGNECSVTTYSTGATFVHPEGAHNFVSPSGAEIYIVYLLPQGTSPAPIPDSATDACA